MRTTSIPTASNSAVIPRGLSSKSKAVPLIRATVSKASSNWLNVTVSFPGRANCSATRALMPLCASSWTLLMLPERSTTRVRWV